ncbi:Uncharacterised protein [uncultured Butyricicoccus sp.]|nr:Uncharacterised protein [uncultured Butyricicoccus sp.]
MLGVLAAVLLSVLAFVVVIPLCLLAAGIVLCGISFVLWGAPANALVTLGCGLMLFALGVLVSLLAIKLCTLFVPPVFRAFVALLRWPFDKLRSRNQGGGVQ